MVLPLATFPPHVGRVFPGIAEDANAGRHASHPAVDRGQNLGDGENGDGAQSGHADAPMPLT